jgi:ABC-type uncharacterized transport system permease subunit
MTNATTQPPPNIGFTHGSTTAFAYGGEGIVAFTAIMIVFLMRERRRR